METHKIAESLRSKELVQNLLEHLDGCPTLFIGDGTVCQPEVAHAFPTDVVLSIRIESPSRRKEDLSLRELTPELVHEDSVSIIFVAYGGVLRVRVEMDGEEDKHAGYSSVVYL